MNTQIDPKVKKERARVLLDLSSELWSKYVDKFIGKEIEVLVEKVEDNKAYGHTNNYIDVCLENKNVKPGDKITVLLQKSMIISK